MTIHKLTTAASTLLLVAAFAAGGYLARPMARGDEPRQAARRRPGPRRRPADADPSRPPAGCSSSAACSIRTASRCRTRRSASPCARKLPARRHGFRGRYPAPVGHGGVRRLGPVPARRAPHLVGASRGLRRRGHRARLRRRLGRARPRRGPAVRRDHAPARAGHRGPPLRRRRASPSRAWWSRSRRSGAPARPAAGDRDGPGHPAHRRTRPLVGPRQRRAGLAQAGDDRRRGPVHRARHRPRPAGQPERPRPAVRPADDRGRHRRPRGREAPEGGAPAGPDRHRPRDRCRHRPAGPSRRGPHPRGQRQDGPYRYTAAETDAEGRFRAGAWRAAASRSRPALPTGSPISSPRRASSGPRGRPSRPSTWPCPAAS